MVELAHGYKKTLVSGTEFIIKETFEETNLSTLGRRLAAYNDDVHRVKVEYDRTIKLRVRSEDHWNLSDVVPDGWRVADGMIHPSRFGKASAHITIEEE